MKTAIVIGVGPNRGLGAQLCKRFAADGLKVIVAGRTQSAVETVAEDIRRTGGQAVPVVADATSERDIAELFDSAGNDLDLAIYNAGNNTPGKIVDMDAGYFEQSWRVVCFGGFLFGREAIRRMLPNKAGNCSLRGRALHSVGGQVTGHLIRQRPGFGFLHRRWRRNTPPTEFMWAMS